MFFETNYNYNTDKWSAVTMSRGMWEYWFVHNAHKPAAEDLHERLIYVSF